MKWIILYILIGLILSAFELKSFTNSVKGKYPDGEERDNALLGSFIVVPIFVVPLWPMLLSLKIIKVFSRKSNA